MPDFYKSVIQYTCLGQQLVNVLYYQSVDEAGAPFDPVRMLSLNGAIVGDVLPALRAVMPPAVTVVGISTTVVNERNVTTSPYAVETALSLPGLLSEDIETPGMVAIASFRVSVPAGNPGTLPTKRSYVAIGPVTAPQIGSNGALSWVTIIKDNIRAALGNTIEGDIDGFVPHRVGRGGSELVDRWGVVNDVVIRPFVSFRRSRLFSPTGQA